MSKDNVYVSVKKVYKDFYLPHEKNSSIKATVVNLFRKKDQSHDTQHALKGISFDVKQGEFFGIVGRNGSGKSTLLKLLAEIYQPTKGEVGIAGRLVPFIELGVGFNPELTGRENVYLNGALLGFSKKEIDERYDDIVEFAELEDFMDQKLKNYSSGMQVRLAFSVATRADADILLIDEVLAVGDADFQRKCFNYFKQLKQQKKTIVFVSHDMGAINEYCDRAILIDDGKVKVQGTAKDVSEEYLKLFNIEQEEHTQRADGGRWGNGWVKFSDVKTTVDAATVTITATVKAKKSVSDVVYGIRIRNEFDQDITGTNSQILQQRHLKIKEGDEKTLIWVVPNILNSGKYRIDPAITIGDGATVCDWWNDADAFAINNDKSTGYLVTPDISLEIVQGKN